MFNRVCKAVVLSSLVLSSSAWAFCDIDESVSPATLSGQCESFVSGFHNGIYTGALKVKLKLPAKSSALSIQPIVCTFTENTGNQTDAIDGYTYFPNSLSMKFDSNGTTYHVGSVPVVSTLFPITPGTEVTITPVSANEEDTAVFHHIEFDNPRCDTDRCEWAMSCHLQE